MALVKSQPSSYHYICPQSSVVLTRSFKWWMFSEVLRQQINFSSHIRAGLSSSGSSSNHRMPFVSVLHGSPISKRGEIPEIFLAMSEATGL